MKRFDRTQEPADFDRQVRKPGLQWLKNHMEWRRPKEYWSQCRDQLADAFGDLCAYSCMYTPTGTVDHFISCAGCRDNQQTHLIYEWTNYRYAAGWINSAKNALNLVLDPFEVQDDWFEIILPSLQLRLVEDRIPANQLALARQTVLRLHLEHDERVIRQRRAWYELYESGDLTLDGLRLKAPLIAKAVEKQQANGV